MTHTIFILCLAVLWSLVLSATDQVAFRSGLVLFKDGVICFSCCGGGDGPADCDDDTACAACTAPSWVVNTPIGYECETEGGGPSSHTLAAGTYGTTHSGSCNWSGSPENCVVMSITCQADEFGVISYSWTLTSDYGLLASGTIDGPCPETPFNVN